MKIIAVDIGGTNSRFVVAEAECHATVKILFEKTYQSNNYPDFHAVLDQLLYDARVTGADYMCLALPGVIKNQKTSLTNLDWEIDARELEQHYPINNISLINDFEAAGLGVDTLTDEDVIVLNHGMHDPENIHNTIKVITGAGTGLGLSWTQQCKSNGKLEYHGTEGGHIDFAPCDDHQILLLEYMLKQHNHVSYERILSGQGLMQLFHFCQQTAGVEQTLSLLPEEIQTRADSGEPVAQAAMEMFVSVYGAFIGNLALLYRPAGGIYIAGGIAAKMVSRIQSQNFLQACFKKGRMSHLVEQTPIMLIINERLGLQGALKKALTITS